MRRSRVPVFSLCQHDLVYDPGGLCPVSPIATGQILRSSGMRLSAVPTPRLRPPGGVIPCGSTTCKQLSRLDTDPADLLHPASDGRLLPPAGVATGLVASHCPWEDLHLLDNFNRFHRGSHPRIPAVTSLTRHDTPLFRAQDSASSCIFSFVRASTRGAVSSPCRCNSASMIFSPSPFNALGSLCNKHQPTSMRELRPDGRKDTIASQSRSVCCMSR